MNGLDSKTPYYQKALYTRLLGAIPTVHHSPSLFLGKRNLLGFSNDDLSYDVIPPVTVVLDGRSICQRINLHKHDNYKSLARGLRQMFVEDIGIGVAGDRVSSDSDIDLSNAIPGHLVAYEDMEDDLLLAGDLNWKDFVRVAKRIRILPVKRNAKVSRET